MDGWAFLADHGNIFYGALKGKSFGLTYAWYGTELDGLNWAFYARKEDKRKRNELSSNMIQIGNLVQHAEPTSFV
ncbi:hypothetical protein ACRALDRAFT_206107 [Sodiomyces alcalophilus JCM 7366]|uniref:uncharacterized protein n=1 Tax=Sodiomyces alcalophilus JCM 7366 TaxID=591952 RepID=UPI0039B3C55D